MANWYSDDIVDLIFIFPYFFLLVANIYNCIRHGITREGGYVLLVLVCLFKIIGNILTVVSLTGASANINIYIWGSILSQLGFYPLLTATLAFIRKWIRVWEGQYSEFGRYKEPLRLINLILIASFILALLGGIWSSPTSSNESEGFTLRKVGDILFTVSVVIIILFVLFLSSMATSREQRFDLQIVQVYIVLPIMLARIIYTVVQAFLSTPANPGHNVWVYLGLLLVPDVISTTIYTVCGFSLPRAPPALQYPQQTVADQEFGKLPETAYPDTGNQTSASQPVSQLPKTSGYGGRRYRRRRGGPIHMLIGFIIDSFKKE